MVIAYQENEVISNSTTNEAVRYSFCFTKCSRLHGEQEESLRNFEKALVENETLTFACTVLHERYQMLSRREISYFFPWIANIHKK